MVKVAWVSRHPPLKAQLETLKEKLGSVEVVQINKTFADYRNVLSAVKEIGAKYAVVVLPLSMIALLVEDRSVVWLYSVMLPVHENCQGSGCPLFSPDTDVLMPPNRHLRFYEFKRIKDVRMILEDW